MKKIVILILVFALISGFCFSDSFNFAGHKWYPVSGRADSFYTTCNTLDELREIGKLFNFNIDNPSDTILNLRNEPLTVEWSSFYEEMYTSLVKDNYINPGIYFIDFFSDTDLAFFKQNNMITMIRILKVGDNSFSRAYKTQTRLPFDSARR